MGGTCLWRHVGLGQRGMTTTKHGICRFCHAFCSLKLTFSGERITNIIGDKNNPVYHGYSCVKGRNFHEFHYSPSRVLRPRRRNAQGSFDEIGLAPATAEIAARLTEIIEEHGPRAVAMYSGTFSHFCVGGVMTRHAFMDAIQSPMRFSNATIDQPGKPIAMAAHGRWGGGPQPFSESDVCLIVGANPLLSMWGGIPPFNPAQRLHEARKRGLKLIVIDPRESETARKADIHLQCLPGNDPAILASLIHVIITESLYDADFVAAETEGFDSLTAAVAPFSPEAVAPRAGVRSEDLRAAARLFATADKGNATGGTGANMAPNGVLMEYLLLALNSLCGRWVKAGERIPNRGVLFRMYSGIARAEKPRPGWGFGEQLRVRGLADTAAGLPTAALADEILTPGDGQVKALFVVGGNPLANWPNRSKVKAALESLDLLVVVDPQMSGTAQLADYVIGPMFGFELPAMSFASEGISTYGLSLGLQEPFAQYQPQLIDPPEQAEVIEDWRFFYELARHMGVPLNYRGMSYDMEVPPTTDDLIEEFVRRSPVPLAEVKPYPEGRVFPKQSSAAEAKDPDWPHRLQIGDTTLLNALTHVDLSSAQANHNRNEFLLVSRRQHAVYNSVGHELPALAKKVPYNPVFLNPDDARRLGVTTGDWVSLANAVATVRGIVEIDGTMRTGVIALAHGFPNQAGESKSQTHKGTSVAALLNDAEGFDPISGLPIMSAVPVLVERVA